MSTNIHPGSLRQTFERPGDLDNQTTPRGPKLAECVACGHQWPESEGVGCPRCVHGPIPIVWADPTMDPTEGCEPIKEGNQVPYGKSH